MSRDINNDIEVFFTALEYKFKEGYDKEYLYDLIFEISNNNEFHKGKPIMKSLLFILKNNWAEPFDIFKRYYYHNTLNKDTQKLADSAKFFSIYGSDNFFRDKILDLLDTTSLDLDYRLCYAINLFKSYSKTDNDIYKNEKFHKLFNEVFFQSEEDFKMLNGNNFSVLEKYKNLIDIIYYAEFKESNFYKDFYKSIRTELWIELIEEDDLNGIISFYDYDIKNRVELDILRLFLDKESSCKF